MLLFSQDAQLIGASRFMLDLMPKINSTYIFSQGSQHYIVADASDLRKIRAMSKLTKALVEQESVDIEPSESAIAFRQDSLKSYGKSTFKSQNSV